MIIIIFVVGVSVSATYVTEDPATLIPTLGVFGMASIRIMPLARNFSFTLNRIRYTKDSVEKLARDLRDTEIEITNLNTVRSPAPKFDNVDNIFLKNISYTYPNNVSPALNKISIKINEGEHIGIVGNSGAGKTTLVDTLLGLLPPSAGKIIINNHDITNHPEALWEHVAYLPQEIFIIDGTVRQNIALGVPEIDIDDVKINLAIEKAQMEMVVSSLPEGIQTNLGENGVRLSGGQRQRIALARAFYFDRRILILDEATSSLDNNTEAQIIDYLKSLKNKSIYPATRFVKSINNFITAK